MAKTYLDNFNKKLLLEIRDENDNFVRGYHFWYNPSEGTDFKLIINGHEYAITGDGKIINNGKDDKANPEEGRDNRINPNFTPYD